jgi:hypothetical protein
LGNRNLEETDNQQNQSPLVPFNCISALFSPFFGISVGGKKKESWHEKIDKSSR